jgi:hypothetical protein
MSRSPSTARKPQSLSLTLSDRCALSYAARILYTIPVCQWSNASDMIDMAEGKPCGRDGYILGQARALWHGSTWPSQENYFASEDQLGFPNGTGAERERVIAHWEKYIAENIAVVRAAEAKNEAEFAKAEADKSAA